MPGGYISRAASSWHIDFQINVTNNLLTFCEFQESYCRTLDILSEFQSASRMRRVVATIAIIAFTAVLVLRLRVLLLGPSPAAIWL
jgi:hypothetical protein